MCNVKEQKAQSFSSTPSLMLVLVILTSVISIGNSCEKAVIGGGCPDINQCRETCRPCYRGIGLVYYFCKPAGAGIPYDQCICRMANGAPCNPVGPPACPRPWPPPSSATTPTNYTEVTLRGRTL